MNNKQRWMGGVVLLGGGILLAALLLKGQDEIHQKQVQIIPVEQQPQEKSGVTGEAVQLQPLTVDVATEKRLLEEQRRSRERAVAEQEAKAAEFLRMQQQAEADAARKAAEEYAAMNARRNAATVREGTDIPPEVILDEKAKAQQKINDQKKVDAEKKLSERKRQAAEADKKAAEEKKRKEQEVAKKKSDAQKAEADRKKLDAQKAEANKKATEEKKRKEQEAAKKKAEADKARKLLDEGDKQWMVQVALAANEANADAVAAKLRAKGYKVTKSPTSKGIRIMVGPAKDRESADNTRKKINSDASLGMKSAWVIDWVPLDQR